MRTSITIFTES